MIERIKRIGEYLCQITGACIIAVALASITTVGITWILCGDDIVAFIVGLIVIGWTVYDLKAKYRTLEAA